MIRAVVQRQRPAKALQWRALATSADKPEVVETKQAEEISAGSSVPTISKVKEVEVEEKKYKYRPQDRPKKAAQYFAVRVGRQVGVFKEWEQAKGKVLEFPGAVYKMFLNEAKARKWLEADLSEVNPKDLPSPKLESEEKDSIMPSKYVLDIGTMMSRAEDETKGFVGIGWVLRKFPERTLVVAGCDRYDLGAWKKTHAPRPGYEPRLPRELPMLEALNRGLDEISRIFKLEEEATKDAPVDSEKKPMKLGFPLYIRCNHSYTVGLLKGANPTIPDLVKPLNNSFNKIRFVSAKHVMEETPESTICLAQGMAKAAIARKFPNCVIEGGAVVPTYNSLLRLINSAPDVPFNVKPAPPPPHKKLEVNGQEAAPLTAKKTASA